MEAAIKEACSPLTRAVDNMAWFYDAHHREVPLYTFREKVWFNRQNIMTTHPMKKMDHTWLDPHCQGSLPLRSCHPS